MKPIAAPGLGDTVDIYEDPITCEKLEGRAIVIQISPPSMNINYQPRIVTTDVALIECEVAFLGDTDGEGFFTRVTRDILMKIPLGGDQ